MGRQGDTPRTGARPGVSGGASIRPRVGILGGGQLGRMLLQAAMNLDLRCSVMDASADAPCAPYCSSFVVGDLNDERAVRAFGGEADIVTIEIENVSVPALRAIADRGVQVFPSPDIVATIQDKGAQKRFLTDRKLPTARWVPIGGADDLARFDGFFPAIQKLRRSGYDGRGVRKIVSRDHLRGGYTEPSIVEELVDIDRELSVIVARGRSGETAAYPPVEMVFHEANLLDYLVAPAGVDDRIAAEANRLAAAVAEELGLVGLAAVEMFVARNGRVLVNEIAPRPHNSGHHTIEANATSQYEQHLRAITGLPLGSTAAICPAVMVNLLGEPGYEGPARYDGLDRVLAIDGARVHLYGKTTTRPHRKMGHVTILDQSREGALRKARLVRESLRVRS